MPLFSSNEIDDYSANDMISKNKAIEVMKISRRSFDKMLEEGTIVQHNNGKKKYYLLQEIYSAMSTDSYKEYAEGVVDKRNSLNDLTGKDWLPETKSFFYQKGLGADHPDAQIEKLHPAPYSFQNYETFLNLKTYIK